MSDRWRDTYDDWKTRSDRDDDWWNEDEPEEEPDVETDIVQRLRQYVENIRASDEPPENYLCGQAADEIERLQNRLEDVETAKELREARLIEAFGEIERLRMALNDIAVAQMLWNGGVARHKPDRLIDFIQELQEIAARALIDGDNNAE